VQPVLFADVVMRTPRNRHHSVPLNRWIPTRPVPMLSDHWLQGYPCFCTLVPRASTFKLLATGCYRHADTLRPIPFDSPRRVDSNVTLSDSGRHLPTEVSPFFSLPTSIAIRTLETYTICFPSTGGFQRTLSDAVRPLVEGLSIHLYLSSPDKYFQIVGYCVLQAGGHFETYTIQFPSASGLQCKPS